MKFNVATFLALILLVSCEIQSSSEKSLDKMKLVESNLMLPVFIEGDSTWTLEERMDHYGVPGVSIAVIYENKIAWSKTYGIMDRDTKIPVSGQTLFQAGSISKPVAAYGALRLVDENKIDLYKDVNSYLTSWELPENEFTVQKKVGLKHLLNHSGGVSVHGFLGYSPDLTIPNLIQVLNGESPANSQPILVNKLPEVSFRYSGGGYTIMQQMMIDIEKKDYPLLMNELVLKPLSMYQSTYQQPLTGEQLALAATGYLPDGSMTKGKRHTYPEMAAAGLWTTANDLALFAIDIQSTLKGESQKVLSQNMATQMLTPFVEEFVGLGIFINKKGKDIYFGHGGWDEGFSSELIAHKEKGYGVVVLTNSNHPNFISELIRSVAYTYNWDNYVPVYDDMKATPVDFEKVVGRYKKSNDDLYEIFVASDNLYVKNLGKDSIQYVKISDTTFVGRDRHSPIQFKINPDNQVVEMFMIEPYEVTYGSHYVRMTVNEKLPFEFLVAGDFQAALNDYKELMKTNPDDEVISENYLNQKGYGLLSSKKEGLARDLFRINTLLYPNSANVYDSYAEALMINENFELAIENYSKSLELDANNENALKMIEEMKGKL